MERHQGALPPGDVSRQAALLLTELRALLSSRSVARGDFVLSSGKRSSYYIDARRTTMSAEGLKLIGALGLFVFEQRRWAPNLVGGLTLGADPVAYAIARASSDGPGPIDAFTVRKTAKEHGRGQRIEGADVRNRDVVVVEDVITTGGSARSAIEAVRAEGGRVLGVFAVVDRLEGGRQALEQDGHAVAALVSVTDLGLRPDP